MKPNPQNYLSTATLLMMATATGLCAGANYFNQPLLSSMASALNISEGLAAATVTLSQVAYAFGLLFLVPLGDKLEQRALAVAPDSASRGRAGNQRLGRQFYSLDCRHADHRRVLGCRANAGANGRQPV